jgi:hypothetical protein
MANVQKQFEQFHYAIRMDYEHSSTLREKRDIILNRIRKHLADNKRPAFAELLQGSYKMKTGVIPIEDLEYDIDVGLRFSFKENDFTAEDVRKWVFEAVDGHTQKVVEKGPCIRVTYSDGYHVDLVSYACWDDVAGITQYRLAHKDNGWVPADPPALLDFVKEAREPYSDTKDTSTQTDQFRRCVRYLRRWDDKASPEVSNEKPTGLAFVLLSVKHLVPRTFLAGGPDDRSALYELAWAAANTIGRISAYKPTPQYEDMFGRISKNGMEALKGRFASLCNALTRADNELDPVDACEILREQFGDDFPVPAPEDTATKTAAPAVTVSSSSA